MTINFKKQFIYTLEHLYGARFEWRLLGAAGAITLWANASNKVDVGIYGGIEKHSCTPPRGSHDAPSPLTCEVLGNRPCWHDGSSLYFEENVKPSWRFPATPEDHARMFAICEEWYISHFCPNDDDDT